REPMAQPDLAVPIELGARLDLFDGSRELAQTGLRLVLATSEDVQSHEQRSQGRDDEQPTEDEQDHQSFTFVICRSHRNPTTYRASALTSRMRPMNVVKSSAM